MALCGHRVPGEPLLRPPWTQTLQPSLQEPKLPQNLGIPQIPALGAGGMDKIAHFSCHPLPCPQAARTRGSPASRLFQICAATHPKPASWGDLHPGTSVLLRGGCSNGVQSTHGWETTRSAHLQSPSLPQSAWLCLLLPLGCSWALQCLDQVRKQADKAGRISACARKHPRLLQ